MNEQRVWKYALEIQEEQHLELPVGSIPLSVIEQSNLPIIYFLVDPYMGARESWAVSIRGTGHPIGREMPKASMFMGTVTTHQDRLVWHIWIRSEGVIAGY